MFEKGTYVTVKRVILPSGERAPSVPEDTKCVPLEMSVHGKLTSEGEMGKVAEVITRCGRIERGVIVEVNPTYRHSFGEYIPELTVIGEDLREILFEGGSDE